MKIIAKPNPKKQRKKVQRYIREKMQEAKPLPEGMPAFPPVPKGYDSWEYVSEGLKGPQHDPWDRCFNKANPPTFTGNTKPTPWGEAEVSNPQDYWDIRAVKHKQEEAVPAKKVKPAIVIDLPASAIVFTEDDGTPINKIPTSIPPWKKKVSSIKYIEWNFSFGDFSTNDNFHIHKLPISSNSEPLIPTNTLKPESTLPYPHTEAGKQYYCLMIYVEQSAMDKPFTTLIDAIKHAAFEESSNSDWKERIRSGNNEAVIPLGTGVIGATIGHRFVACTDQFNDKRKYLFQLVLEPSKLTIL